MRSNEGEICTKVILTGHFSKRDRKGLQVLFCLKFRSLYKMDYCWKEIHERLGSSPESHKDEYVCIFCVEDDGLRGFIEREAYANACTFCGKESTDPIAASLIEVLLYINECLSREYDAPEEQLPHESAEGGYMGQVLTTRDLLEEHLGHDLPNDNDGTLMDALCDGLEEGRGWCQKDYFWDLYGKLSNGVG